MFEKFWPSFFAFLIVIFLMIGLYRPDLMDTALIYVGGYFIILLYVVLAAAVIFGAVMLYIAARERQSRANRPVDGAFPLQKYRLKDGRTLIVNPNTMISPAAYIDKRAGYQEWEHPAGWDVVVRIRELVERANMIRAMFPGDQARMDPNGAMSMPPRLGGNETQKLLDAKPLPPPRVIGDTIPPTPLPPPPAIDPATAIAGSPPTAPAVGQTANGQIVRWSLAQFPHARWHGASQGSGKTNGAKVALLGLARAGAHVVILDRRRFKDFGDFSGHAELIDTSSPAAFVEAMQRLETIYRERDRILGAHGAANIDVLPQRLVRYVVLITEFGTLCSVAESEGLLRPALGPLTRIMREAAATGVHIVLEDQITERWPRGIAANANGVFVGQLPANLGQAAGYYHADKLRPYEFHHDGKIFRTWDAAPLTRQLLATAPAYDPRLAVLDGVARPVGDGERSGAGAGPFPRANGQNERSMNGGTTGANPEDDPDYWADVVADWFRAHPAALTGPALGISDLARAMARHATGDAGNYEAYKSRAHKLFHAFRQSARLPGGERLGVDITKD